MTEQPAHHHVPARIARWAGSALAISNLAGMIIAIRRHVAPRPFGLRSPIHGWAEPVVWGTALSAPLPMIVTLGTSPWRRNLTVTGALAITDLVGQLAEPIAWQRHRPRLASAVIAANVTLSALTIAATSYSRRRRGSRHDTHPHRRR
jgi:hypothetical protein